MDRIEQIVWNPFTKGYYENPYHHLGKCRETNPVQIASHGSWTFFKYEDVSNMLRSKDFIPSNLEAYLSEKEGYIFNGTSQCPYLAQTIKWWPMYLDGSFHKTIRTVIMKVINQLNFKRIVYESVEVVNRKFTGIKEFDLSTYCGFYIHEVLKKAFDVPLSYMEMCEYSNHAAVAQDIYVPKQVYRRINDWLLWGRDQFKNSQYKIQLEEQLRLHNVEYTDSDIYSLMSLSIMAAFETSKDNLTIALIELLKKRELVEYTISVSDKKLNKLIEEAFRFTCPLQFTIRVNKKAIQIGDLHIPADSKLYLCLASANRDPDKFEYPDQIILNRYPNDHLSFGGGSHFCLGANTARLEMRACLKPMLSFLKEYELDQSSITWKKQVFMRHLSSATIKRKISC